MIARPSGRAVEGNMRHRCPRKGRPQRVTPNDG
uniref:Uncharacterized protein n=1 Tax=Podoviridae sp. ctyDR6 TaxID=2825288 RepID=A0A8S5QLJ5_9CAUD|nr:MAG TPA: hypothetical protein [Podoviridae sp. ctyDR6]